MSNLPSGYQEPPTDPLYEAEFMRDKAERERAEYVALYEAAEAKLARVRKLFSDYPNSANLSKAAIRDALDGAE